MSKIMAKLGPGLLAFRQCLAHVALVNDVVALKNRG